MRRFLVVLAVVLVSTLAVSGGVAAFAYVFGLPSGPGRSGDVAAAGTSPDGATPPTTAPTTTTAPPTTTTTEPPLKQPEMVEFPPLRPGGIGPGDEGLDVFVYEFRLGELHFDPGPIDGVYDSRTAFAVQGVQKMFGAPVTGEIDEGVRFGLTTFQWPEPMVPGGEPDRVEVDLDRQILVLWDDDVPALVTPVSSGNGTVFCGGNDGCQYATTPVGRFTFQWHYNGWRDGDLGELYNPFYFNGGIAVHGYESVPASPGSHGCVRIPMHIADYFPDRVVQGEPIYVLGTQIAPFGPESETYVPPPYTPMLAAADAAAAQAPPPDPTPAATSTTAPGPATIEASATPD